MNEFKDDIEAAERQLLLWSWAGVIASLSLIVYTILRWP